MPIPSQYPDVLGPRSDTNDKSGQFAARENERSLGQLVPRRGGAFLERNAQTVMELPSKVVPPSGPIFVCHLSGSRNVACGDVAF